MKNSIFNALYKRTVFGISHSTAIPVFVYAHEGIEGQPIHPAGGEVLNFDSWITDELQFAFTL